MNEKKLDEWGDRDIRGEISNAEEIYIGAEIYSNPQRYAEYCERVKAEARVRDGIRASAVALPPDFFQSRLKQAIDESPVWERWAEKRAARAVRTVRFRNAKRWLLTVGASAATVAVVAVWALGSGKATPNVGVDVAENGNKTLNETPSVGDLPTPAPAPVLFADTGRRDKMAPIQIPSPNKTGNPRDLERNNEYRVYFLGSEKDFKSIGGDFQRFCNKNEVAFTKLGLKNEYLAQNVSPKTWALLAGWLKERACQATPDESNGNKGALVATSDAVDRWCSNLDGKARDIRVSFKIESTVPATPAPADSIVAPSF